MYLPWVQEIDIVLPSLVSEYSESLPMPCPAELSESLLYMTTLEIHEASAHNSEAFIEKP
jgi:hypothetical protein